MRSAIPDLVCIVDDDDNAVYVWRQRVLIQVRRRHIDAATLRRIHSWVTENVVDTERFGALLVVETSGTVPPEDVRKLQRQNMDSLLARVDARVVGVLLGDDVTSAMKRTVIRLLFIGNRRVHMASSVDEAVTWLQRELRTPAGPSVGRGAPDAPPTNLDSAALLEFIERVRRRERVALSGSSS